MTMSQISKTSQNTSKNTSKNTSQSTQDTTVKSIIVKKFGGTSVGSVDRIKNVAKRIIETKTGTGAGMVIVVSAMGKTTDQLVSLAKEMSPNPHPREYDALISTGENVSAALLAMCLQDMGHDAISLTGFQAGIRTESFYSKAKILEVNPARLKEELEAGKIVVVTGFQGFNASQDVTTIGRGGSDTSAVVLAAALGLSECDIYTDVDGVYTTDPRIEPNASKISEISYEEMLEMASLGAGVLHPRAVECGKENNIKIHVRSSFKPDSGTMVKEASDLEVSRPVTGVALKEDECIVSIMNIPDEPGVAGKIFTQLGQANINVDMIIQSEKENNRQDITFTVCEDDQAQAEKVAKAVCRDIGGERVKVESDIAKISIVGVGMISKPGIAAKMFRVLGENSINLKLITTSEIKISCAISEAAGKDAVRLLHQAFELDCI